MKTLIPLWLIAAALLPSCATDSMESSEDDPTATEDGENAIRGSRLGYYSSDEELQQARDARHFGASSGEPAPSPSGSQLWHDDSGEDSYEDYEGADESGYDPWRGPEGF